MKIEITEKEKVNSDKYGSNVLYNDDDKYQLIYPN